MVGMDAARIAQLYMEKVAKADNAVQPSRRAGVRKSASKPSLAAHPRTGVAKKKSSAAAHDQPQSTYAAEVRTACRVGTSVWLAERDGALVVRDAASGKVIEKILPHGWEIISSMVALPSTVWCGTSDGPILVFDRQSRRVLHEARHSGGVQCLCAAPNAGGRGFVVSGGSDWKATMWQLDGKRLLKTFNGHTGAVRCALVLGLEIFTGSDDGSIRVWEAACGLFQLESEPCRAVLSGHSGAVHALLSHSGGLLSCGADGTVRCWQAGGAHECLREVALPGGPVYQLVPMGRGVWASGADGHIHALDGVTLEPSAPPRAAHAGFVSGLCTLQARTTRQCWSYSTADARVCVWRTEEVEPQHTSERAGVLRAELASVEEQLSSEVQARSEEQQQAADERRRDAQALAASEAALDEAREAQRQLLAELASSMDVQERDVREAERLREQLAAREAELAEREVASASAIKALESRLAAAEEAACAQAEELAAQAARAERLDAAALRQQQCAERLARKFIAAAVRERRAARELSAAPPTRALTRAPGGWGTECVHAGAEDLSTDAAAAAARAGGSTVFNGSLASTVASSVGEFSLEGDSHDIPTVSAFVSGAAMLRVDGVDD